MNDPQQKRMIGEAIVLREEMVTREQLVGRAMSSGIRFGFVLGVLFAMLVWALLGLATGAHAATRDADACLSVHECIGLHAGYCRRHAGCWHVGARHSHVAAAAQSRQQRSKPIKENPYGDPIWDGAGDIEVDPYDDPIWLGPTPHTRVGEAFNFIKRTP
jgi:hypothetical protein